MYLSTTSTTNGLYTPPKFEGDTGSYKEKTVSTVTDKKKPTLPELKQTLAHEHENLDALMGVFENRLGKLNALTGSNYSLGKVIDFQA